MSDWNVPHNPEPPGSPAYVRRLRDQAAVSILAGLYAAGTGHHQFKNLRHSREHATDEANALMITLGYQVPEDGEVKS